jgi:hypothetical protein
MSSLLDPATILFGPRGLGDRACDHVSGDWVMASESGFLWTPRLGLARQRIEMLNITVFGAAAVCCQGIFRFTPYVKQALHCP